MILCQDVGNIPRTRQGLHDAEHAKIGSRQNR
jgi:hypothetical protein